MRPLQRKAGSPGSPALQIRWKAFTLPAHMTTPAPRWLAAGGPAHPPTHLALRLADPLEDLEHLGPPLKDGLHSGREGARACASEGLQIVARRLDLLGGPRHRWPVLKHITEMGQQSWTWLYRGL